MRGTNWTDVCFRNSEMISGTLGKTALGGGSKGSLFYTLIKQYGSAVSAECMWRLAKLASRFMGNRGLSIGITDVQPAPKLVRPCCPGVRWCRSIVLTVVPHAGLCMSICVSVSVSV